MDANSELFIRIGAALGIFLALALWEVLSPRRTWSIGRARRWPGNLGIWCSTRAGAAADARGGSRNGLYRRGTRLGVLISRPAGLSSPASSAFLVLDLVIYAQHFTFHHVPAAVAPAPHAPCRSRYRRDPTGLRFHPIEIIISMLIKIAVVLARRHSGRRGPWCSRSSSTRPRCSIIPTSPCRSGSIASSDWLVVTPDMHRVHHSIVRARNGQQFRLQCAVVGSPVRHLPAGARGRPYRGHDDRHSNVPQCARAQARPPADAAVPR